MLQRISVVALVLALCVGARAQTDLSADMRKAIAAIEAGKADELERLLKSRPGLTSELDAEYEATLLHWAAAQKDLKAVSLLINEHKAPLDATNKEGATPLHVALVPKPGKPIGAGLLNLVKKLATPDVVKIATLDGKTALHLACQYNQLEVARFLIEEMGADVNALTNDKKDPLHYALKAKNPKLVELLKADKAEKARPSTPPPPPPPPAPPRPATTNAGDAAPLWAAVGDGDLEEVKRILLKNRQLIDAANGFGETPLHLAAKNRRLYVVAELIRQGANVNLKDKHQRTFWDLLCPPPPK